MLISINKNSAKRTPVSAVFRVEAGLPETAGVGPVLPNGPHVVGFIEGNVVITKVTHIVTEGFNGTAPTLSVTDSNGGDWFTDTPIDATIVGATASTTPVYYGGKTQFNISYTGSGSTSGGLYIAVDYIQLDTEPGCHTAGE